MPLHVPISVHIIDTQFDSYDYNWLLRYMIIKLVAYQVQT